MSVNVVFKVTHCLFGRLALVLGVVVPLALQSQGCTTPTHDRVNLVVICIDTLRADHVGAYGYQRPTTPTIDALARRGARFESAQATSPWTVPSTVSILTSLMPSEHGSVRTGAVKQHKDPPREVRRDVVNLAGILGEAGYRTALFSGNLFVRGRILRDFDRWENRLVGVSEINRVASDWLKENAGQPFFLYLQPFDLHAPIEPPDPYFEMFEAAAGGVRGETHKDWDYFKQADPDDEDFVRFSQHKVALYDGALRYVDDAIDELLELLSDLGVAEQTLVVITSDHGEEFWDHFEIERRLGGDPREMWGVGHGHSMFQELLHVPLVIAGPGVAEARSIRCPISLVDLAPTLLDLMGIPAADAMQGESHRVLLSPEGRAGTCEPVPVFAEAPAFGVNARSVLAERRYKLIDRNDGVRLLYDLREDPDELHDLAAERPDLLEALAGLFDRSAQPAEPGEMMQLDEETLEELRALGYLE